jgi:hypothetical protein
MLNFFVLTSLTYFFKDFAFSRVVLLMLVSFGILFTGLIRILLAVYDRSLGKESDRRIAIVGANEAAAQIIRALQSAETRNADLVGIIVTSGTDQGTVFEMPVIGGLSQLPQLIEQHHLDEIIITDNSIQRKELMQLVAGASGLSARFHVAMDYEDIVTSRIINEVAGIEPTLPPYNLARLRYRTAKRCFDITASLLMLTIGLPVVGLVGNNFRAALKKLCGGLVGKYSIVGLYPSEDGAPVIGKIGLTGLAHISRPSRLSPQVIRELNEYYVQHYTLTLDWDILLKGLFRKSNVRLG